MSKLVLDMSVSVDGFIAGPDDSAKHGLGVDGEMLHGWLAEGGVDPKSYRPGDRTSALVFDELMNTGAVIAGRRTFEFAGGWNGDHHDDVPIFVLTHSPPDEPAPGSATYVTDVESCVARAKAAAGERDILLHGAATAQACLRAGLLDTWCRCCSVRDAGSSRSCLPTTSSSSCSARSRRRACST